MQNASDLRIPVLFAAAAGQADAVWLVEAGMPSPGAGYAEYFNRATGKLGHLPGCACCTVRSPAADALARLFRTRAIGQAPFFRSVIVVASPDGEAELRAAIEHDVLVAARYRLVTPSPAI